MSDAEHDNSPGPGRRGILRGTGLGALALGGLATAGALTSFAGPADAQGITDADILNFALNLEYLEAEFYVFATTGHGLPAKDTGGSGGPSGGVTFPSTPPNLSGVVLQYALEIAADELDHVLFLRSALGSQAVSEPKIDLDSSFNTLASAAGLPTPFSPYTSNNNFLLGAYIFEDVGVTAYHGAAPLVQNKQILGAAAGILGTEAYHASEIRLQLFQLGQPYWNYSAKISALRAKLSQANDDQGVAVKNMPNIALTDSNGLVFARTPRQVLNIVYAGIGASSGLFYPNGMNGAIK